MIHFVIHVVSKKKIVLNKSYLRGKIQIISVYILILWYTVFLYYTILHWSNCVSNIESQDFLWIFPMAILREGAIRGQSHFPVVKYFATYLLPQMQEYLLMDKCSLKPVGFIWLSLVWHLHSAYKITECLKFIISMTFLNSFLVYVQCFIWSAAERCVK